jgi:hypothetical protein
MDFYWIKLDLKWLKLKDILDARYIYLIFLEPRTDQDLLNKICFIEFGHRFYFLQFLDYFGLIWTKSKEIWKKGGAHCAPGLASAHGHGAAVAWASRFVGRATWWPSSWLGSRLHSLRGMACPREHAAAVDGRWLYWRQGVQFSACYSRRRNEAWLVVVFRAVARSRRQLGGARRSAPVDDDQGRRSGGDMHLRWGGGTAAAGASTSPDGHARPWLALTLRETGKEGGGFGPASVGTGPFYRPLGDRWSSACGLAARWRRCSDKRARRRKKEPDRWVPRGRNSRIKINSKWFLARKNS